MNDGNTNLETSREDATLLGGRSATRQKKVNICYFVHSSNIGGAPLSLLFLIQQLDRERYAPTVVFPSDSPLRQMFEESQIPTLVSPGMSYFSHTTLERIVFKNPRSLLQVIKFLPTVLRSYRLVQRLKPDIVHLNSSALAPQVIGAKLAGPKVLWHIREPIHDGVFGLRRALMRWVARRFTDTIVVILQGDVDRMGAPEKTHVIYNFTDFTLFDRNVTPHSSGDGTTPYKTVIMLGGVAKTKGTLEFVKAYPRVREKMGQVRFLIASFNGLEILKNKSNLLKRFARWILRSDSYIRNVHNFVAEYCDDGVVFIGTVQDVPGCIASADLLVFPSTTPHFARPIIEAGAMAKPVVASDLEGPRELVENGKTGLLVPPGDPVALAEAIIAVLRDGELATSLGEGGYARASRLFKSDANSQATFSLYKSLIEEKTSSTSETSAGCPKDG